MSERIGLTVLRQVAAHYRANPESWCIGAGALWDTRARQTKNPALMDEELKKKPCKQGCIYTGVVCQSIVLAGAQAWHMAVTDAVTILCEHHGLSVDSKLIFYHNDAECKTAEDAISFVEAALGKPPVKTLRTPAAKAPAASSSISRELMAAAIAAFTLITTLGYCGGEVA